MKTPSLAGLMASFKGAAAQGATDLAAFRARIRDVQRLISDAERASSDLPAIERRATALVDGAISDAKARGGPFSALAVPEASYSPNTASVSADTLTSFELGCLLDRKGMIAMLVRESVAAGGDSGVKPMSEDLRTKTIEKLTAEARSLAASEEMLVRELEAAGLNPERRSDASPEIILAFDNELEALAA